MTNVLDGVQYRTLKAQLPTWKVDENYNDWEDCGSSTEFPSGTEFRVKEEIEYVVTFNSRKDTATPDKNKAMARVAKLLEDGFEVSVNKYAKTQPGIATFLTDKGVQFKLVKSDKWLNPPHFGGTAIASPIRFRKRPDSYFQVDIKNATSMSTIIFDDVDVLDTYVSRQLRTSDNNLIISRRAYGLNI